MLVLGRKVGGEVLIGDDIRLVVVSIRGNQVRLGFDAPPEVAVRRSEIDGRYARSAEPVDAGLIASEPLSLQKVGAP